MLENAQPPFQSMKGYRDAVPRKMCTDCGVSRSKDPARCGQACQFIKPEYKELESRVHGHARSQDLSSDEVHFGPFKRIVRAELIEPRLGAQWTGITTRICERLLEARAVDAILTMKPDSEDRWKPVPTLVTNAADLHACRGMRMGYAPLLALLEPAIEEGYKRIGIVGIPCQIYALRALEHDLGLEQLFVIGTPCSDNTTTENFHRFLSLLSDNPESITYLEFRADYQVELRFDDGGKREIPFLKLPISQLPRDFFPLTCRTCVDYTNALADITVGYMGGQGQQWLIVRNERGEELLSLLGNEVRLSEPGTRGKRQRHVAGFKSNVVRAAGGLPVRSMPDFMRPIAAWLMPKIGPRGQEFARARVEMKAIETVFHLRNQLPKQMKNMIPDHVWALVENYDVKRRSGE